MGKKSIVTICIVLALVVGGIFFTQTMVGYIDAKDWHFVQPYWGSERIQNGSGWYIKGFAKAYPYPRYMEFVYSDEEGEGEADKEAIEVTFNDGSNGFFDAFIVISTPDESVDQIAFHKKMGGSPSSVKNKVKAHLTECFKSTAPLMSSTEHQVSRKSDFSMKVEKQLSEGIYDMKQVSKILLDRVDEKGNAVTVPATEIVIDAETGKPVIAKESPLIVDYKMKIVQFSIKGTRYDDETLLQFAAKKEQFLSAETSKSEREAMVQEALKIEAEGLKDKAQAEAIANVLKASAVIAAEQKAEVALQAKIEAETVASMALAVALIDKEQAQINLDIAELDGQAVIVLARAEREKIELAGALTELETAMIDAKVQMAGEVANALAQIQVPSVMIIGGVGEGGDSASNVLGHLINMKLMKDSGLMDITDINEAAIKRTIKRDAAAAAARNATK